MGNFFDEKNIENILSKSDFRDENQENNNDINKKQIEIENKIEKERENLNVKRLNKRNGKYANINYKAISMDDLRLHPNYKSLPLPENVICNSPSDYWLYRQDSLEWNLLHQGRLTTSKLAAC